MTPASVTYSISKLEKHYNQPLLKRTTRSFSLTDAGERCYQAGRSVPNTLVTLENNLTKEFEKPKGMLRIEVSTALSSIYLAQILPEFLAQYPELQLSLSVSDRLVNPAVDRADIFIRFGDTNAPDMACRELFRQR